MSKQQKIDEFDPNGVGLADSGLFGLPFSNDEAEVVILPIPWDVTVSYGDGTSNAPEAILQASKQVDLYYAGHADAWKMGIAMEEIPQEWTDLNRHYRKKASEVIDFLENGVSVSDGSVAELLQEINAQCEELVDYVYRKAMAQLQKGKHVALLGGDHSTPLGIIKAMGDHFGGFGILHVDAHADLRDAYEGFTYSHASIMFNALKLEKVEKLVSVGLRDVCQAEMDIIYNSNDRVVAFFDEHLKQQQYTGRTWQQQVKDIISELPKQVYISFDIDGLDPKLCPLTGTPVPGGLEFHEAVYLIKEVVASGRTIIGFDLVEVGPAENEWDTNVGARLLYHLCNQLGISNGLIK
jgi:agmatinase